MDTSVNQDRNISLLGSNCHPFIFALLRSFWISSDVVYLSPFPRLGMWSGERQKALPAGHICIQSDPFAIQTPTSTSSTSLLSQITALFRMSPCYATGANSQSFLSTVRPFCLSNDCLLSLCSPFPDYRFYAARVAFHTRVFGGWRSFVLWNAIHEVLVWGK
jgi:hypothetical protein